MEGDIEIRFGDDVFRGNYLNDLVIQEQDMNRILAEHPGRFVFWSRMAAIAKILLERSKQELEQYEAQMYGFFRSQSEQRGEKATEKGITSRIELDERRNALFTAFLRAKLQSDHLGSIAEAFKIRTHMLMSISANVREELSGGDMSVRGEGIGTVNAGLRSQVRPPMPAGSRRDTRAAALRAASGMAFGEKDEEV